MTTIDLSIACALTDRTRPLVERRVVLDGYHLDFSLGEPQEIFRTALREKRFEITEMSMGSHLLATARGEADYIALPVFLSRSFRHSAVYIRTDRGIRQAGDLAGKRIGLPEYQQTAALWVRGMLQQSFGVDLATIVWRTGGLETAGLDERIPLGTSAARRVVPIGPDQTLNTMLAAGEIDAIISPRAPSCFAKRSAPVARLFEPSMPAEQAYYAATGFFPIMHCLALRRDVAAAHPDLPAALFSAFAKAKALSEHDLTLTNYHRVALPWIADHLEQTRRIMGDEIWRYGFQASLGELEAMVDYAAADGLTARRVDPAELFHPATLSLES